MNIVNGVKYLDRDSKYWFATLIPSLLISGGSMLETSPHAVIRSGILQAQVKAWGPPPDNPSIPNLSMATESANAQISSGQSNN